MFCKIVIRTPKKLSLIIYNINDRCLLDEIESNKQCLDKDLLNKI